MTLQAADNFPLISEFVYCLTTKFFSATNMTQTLDIDAQESQSGEHQTRHLVTANPITNHPPMLWIKVSKLAGTLGPLV